MSSVYPHHDPSAGQMLVQCTYSYYTTQTDLNPAPPHPSQYTFQPHSTSPRQYRPPFEYPNSEPMSPQSQFTLPAPHVANRSVSNPAHSQNQMTYNEQTNPEQTYQLSVYSDVMPNWHAGIPSSSNVLGVPPAAVRPIFAPYPAHHDQTQIAGLLPGQMLVQCNYTYVTSTDPQTIPYPSQEAIQQQLGGPFLFPDSQNGVPMSPRHQSPRLPGIHTMGHSSATPSNEGYSYFTSSPLPFNDTDGPGTLSPTTGVFGGQSLNTTASAFLPSFPASKITIKSQDGTELDLNVMKKCSLLPKGPTHVNRRSIRIESEKSKQKRLQEQKEMEQVKKVAGDTSYATGPSGLDSTTSCSSHSTASHSPSNTIVSDEEHMSISASPFIPTYRSSSITIESEDGTESKANGLLLSDSVLPTVAIFGRQSLNTAASPFVPGCRPPGKDTSVEDDMVLKNHDLFPPGSPPPIATVSGGQSLNTSASPFVPGCHSSGNAIESEDDIELKNHASILPGSPLLRAAICDRQSLNTSASPFIPSYRSSVVTIRSDDGTELKKDGLLRSSSPPTAAVFGGQSLSTSASPFVPGSRLSKVTIKNEDGVELTPEVLKKHSLAPPSLPGGSADSRPTWIESKESKKKHLHEQKLKSWPKKEIERPLQEVGEKDQLIKEADERQRIQREQDLAQQQLNEQKILIQAWLQETKDQHGQDLENARISEPPNKVLSPSPSIHMKRSLNATAGEFVPGLCMGKVVFNAPDEAETSSEAGKRHPVFVPRTHSSNKSQDGAECALGSSKKHDRGLSRSSDAVEETSVDGLTKAKLLERRQQKQDRIESLLSILAQQTLP